MQALLYVGHGSRVEAGSEELRKFVRAAMEHVDVAIQETCFIELTEPSITAGIEACVKQGATKIAVIPVLLLTAGHAKVDIPAEIAKAKERFPDVCFSYGRPFGIHEAILGILGERLCEQGFQFDDQAITERQDVSILLVGRGSSDPDANSDLAKIGRLVWEKYPVKSVDVCYLAATQPSFDEGLERMVALPTKAIYVLPYLLFTGILMKSMRKKIRSYQETLEMTEIELCDYLGYHEKLVHVLLARVDEVVNK